jgi:monomeric sarcosine oxidase
MTHVTVVGAGVMGCATAWALTARGADVTVVEQFDVDHDRGSSHGRSRIVRLAYSDPHWVRLAQEAQLGWRRLEAESGRQLLQLHGLVELASSPHLTSADALTACGVEFELLDADGVRAFGAILPDGWTALHQPEAGIVLADVARHAFLDGARSRGARVETGRRVTAVDELDGDVVVLTAGPWIRQLVPDLPVKVTRETIVYFHVDRPQASIVELDERTRGHASFSLHDPVHGLKAGRHLAGVETEPDAEGAPAADFVQEISAWVEERFPEVDPRPVDAETCLYTSTANESFICERRGRVVIGSPCSGHGFKFAPVVGERLAALALSASRKIA